MEELVGVETGFVAVWVVAPFVQSRQSSFGAVHNHKIPITVDLEDLDVVWLWDVEDFDGLKLGEPVLLLIKPVDVGAAEELSDNYQDMVVNQDGLTSNNWFSCEEK